MRLKYPVAMLIGGSALLVLCFELVGISAGLLLGPMIVGICLAATDHPVAIPEPAFKAAQAMLGIMIASSFDSTIISTVGAHPVVFFGTSFATLAASALLGYALAHWHVLPGTSAIWGSMPGAASAMTLMARSFGADWRVVAVMTYVRVICVAGTASLLGAVVAGHTGTQPPGGSWFPSLEFWPAVQTFSVALTGAAVATRLGLPAAALMGPLVLGTVLHMSGFVTFALPGWLLAISYALIGWRIGLSFTREVLVVTRRALPRLLLAIGTLMAFCALLAWAIASVTGIDMVTAYLATSPGGMDSVAIIATTIPVDVPFVMAMQALRFVTVLLLAPPLARIMARRAIENSEPGP